MRLTRLLFGVPKFRTSKRRFFTLIVTLFLAKKMTRKFSYTKLYSLNENLVSCAKCGSPHDVRTICGTCYQGISNATNRIKESMMSSYRNQLPGKTKKSFVAKDEYVQNNEKSKEVITEKIKKKTGWFF